MLALIALLTFVTTAPAFVAKKCPTLQQPQTTAGVAEAEALWIKSLEDRDAVNLACLLDEQFADNSWTGAVRTRTDVLKAVSHRTASTIELKELETRVEGTAGVATGLTVIHDSSGKVVASARFTDVFIFRNGRWRAIAAQETGLSSPSR